MEAAVPDRSGFYARCVLRAGRVGTLATVSDGQPFASLVTPAVAPDGSVLLLLSSLAAHTRHLLAQPRCAVMVAGRATDENPQTAPRVSVTGMAVRLDESAPRRFWVARHPYAALYADFSDFAVWRLVPEAAHYVGGFAQAAVLGQAAFLPEATHVAAVAEAEARIIDHCNADHRDVLNLLARARGRTGEWRMIGVDVDGFDAVQDDTVLRIAFDAPVDNAAAVHAALVRMAGD
jgi:putative heme iron utilization protein